MKTLSKNNIILLVISGIFVLVLLSFLFERVSFVQGSVSVTDEYQATTTSTGTFAAIQTLTSTTTPKQGTLGSVIITGAAAGQIVITDATTSNITQRSADQSTSTIRLADIPVSAAAGTYTFDIVYKRGLVVSVIGTMPTTTITFR